MTHYDTLQVSPEASPEVIEASWKALMRMCHPDVNPGKTKSKQAAKINEAHDVLSDPEKRKAYDLELSQTRERSRPKPVPVRTEKPAPTVHFNPQELYEEFLDASNLPNTIQTAILAGATQVINKVIQENPIIGQIFEHLNKKRQAG